MLENFIFKRNKSARVEIVELLAFKIFKSNFHFCQNLELNIPVIFKEFEIFLWKEDAFDCAGI